MKVLELKSVIFKIERLMVGFNSRLDIVEEGINQLRYDFVIEFIEFDGMGFLRCRNKIIASESV